MPDSPWTDLARPPLHEDVLRRALVEPGGLWTALDVRAETGSTNADVLQAAQEGAPEGLVIVAESQTAGRGRLGRTWTAPPRSALTFSMLLRPGAAGTAPGPRGAGDRATGDRGTGVGGAVPVERWAWLPLLAGVAVAAGVDRLYSLDTGLKWPNDLVLGTRQEAPDASVDASSVDASSVDAYRGRTYGGRKLGGILAERAGDAVVVGVGLNVGLDEAELPVPTAISLHLAGAPADRDPLLRAVLRAFASWYRRWRDAEGDAVACGLAEEYRARCTTIGRRVRVELPGGQAVEGEAAGVDGNGRLTVRTPEGERTVGAGDVVHLR